MPIDASIPLGIQPPQAQVNPLAMINQWAQIQNAMNQNRLFQQTFAARQRAGQILSSAPDLETGLELLARDPVAGPFAAEYMGQIRQAQQSLAATDKLRTETAGLISTQGMNSLDSFKKGLPLLLSNPTDEAWDALATSALSTATPESRVSIALSMDSLKKSILGGLPPDADLETRKKLVARNMVALAIPTGLPIGGLNEIFGTPERVDVGGSIQPTLRAPSFAGGGERPVGPSFNKTLAPQITTQGGVPIQVPDPRLGGAAGSNPLTPSVAPTSPAAPLTGNELMQPYHEQIEVNPLAPPPGAQDSPVNAPNGARSRAVPPAYASDLGLPGSQRPGAAAAPQAQTETELAGDGKPLYEGLGSTPRVGRSNLTGTNILSPAQSASADALMKRFQGEELDAYRNNVASLGALDRMDHALETMAQSGGLLTPGAFGNTRLEMARTLNLLGGLVGYWDPSKPPSETNKAPVDPNAIATAEDLRKEATRAGMLFLSQTLGAQREAASVIFSTIQAVPGLDNTLLGGRIVSRSLRAAAEREIDLRKFQERWADENQGDLSGSVAAFNKAHPGRAYFDKLLDSMGMSEDGFEDPAAIQRAFKAGYLTKNEAASFLLEQFPDQFKARR